MAETDISLLVRVLRNLPLESLITWHVTDKNSANKYLAGQQA